MIPLNMPRKILYIYNSVQLFTTLLARTTTLVQLSTTIDCFAPDGCFFRSGFFLFGLFLKKTGWNGLKSNLMDFDRRMIRPEVEGSTQQTLTAQRKEDEREGIPNEEQQRVQRRFLLRCQWYRCLLPRCAPEHGMQLDERLPLGEPGRRGNLHEPPRLPRRIPLVFLLIHLPSTYRRDQRYGEWRCRTLRIFPSISSPIPLPFPDAFSTDPAL